MFCESVVLLLTVILIAIGYKIRKAFRVPPKPVLVEQWWGAGEQKKVDTSVRPFKIDISQKIIDDLSQRLNNARNFVRPIESAQQQYGMNTKLLSEIVDFWKSKYNWREREAFLNQFPQFKTNILGLDVHFLHVKPTTAEGLRVIPLLLLHGWPGSVREFYELIPILTKRQPGKDFIFEVIAPSLPGFGFSDPTPKEGLCPIKISLIFKHLMLRLGFNKYYVQGGDWGAVISSQMATLFPNEVKGAHLNFANIRNIHPMAKIKMAIRNFFPQIFECQTRQNKILAKAQHFLKYESGYHLLQSTKPDTVGVGLNDSPVGLAAYIIEKFTTWTNPAWQKRADGGLLDKYTYTKLLDNVMIYWVTNSITSSMRIYYERYANAADGAVMDRIPVTVPVAYAKCEHELWHIPDDVMNGKYLNLVHSECIPNAGHFAALEEPEALAKDIWKAFGKILDFYK